MLRGLLLARVLLGRVAELAQVGMAEEAVVVEADLGVEREEPAVARDDQGVDLGERAVGLDEAAREGGHEADRLRHLLLREAETERESPRLIRREADRRVDRLAHDLLRRARRHLLDLDAALGRRHHRRTIGGAVDHHAEVELARDLTGTLDEQPADDPALGAGLVGDERLPEERARRRVRLADVAHDLHAASLTAPAGVDLGFHDAGKAHPRGGRDGSVDRVAGLPVRHGDLVTPEELLRLMLMDVHGHLIVRRCP